MTKQKFISEAKQLGFNKYQELVAKLGYNARTLSRYKKDDELSSKFVEAFEQYKNDAKPVQKQDLEDIDEVQKPKRKKPQVENVQEVKEHQHTQEVKQKETTVPKDKKEIGIDISNEDYHSGNKMSVSKLKVMLDNAKEFESRYVKKEIEQKDTDALIVGRLHHTLVLEPHKFDDEYTVVDMPARPVKDDLVDALEKLGGEVELKENGRGEIIVADTVEQLKAKIDKIKGSTKKIVCTKAQYELAQQTSKKALDSWFELVVGGKTILKAQLKQLLELDKCYVEKTFYGEINGVEVQIRPDILINLGLKNDVWFVIDLKTLEVATPNMFVKQGGAFFWDMQEQFYLEVLRQNGINPKAFYFNCAGKKEFSGAGFYEWGVSTKDEAKKVVQAGLNKYKYCMETNLFLEGKFDFTKMKFEPITTVDVPVYRQYTLGDLGV